MLNLSSGLVASVMASNPVSGLFNLGLGLGLGKGLGKGGGASKGGEGSRVDEVQGKGVVGGAAGGGGGDSAAEEEAGESEE